MKKILSLIILVLYLFPAVGMTVSTHYCSGKLADVSWFGSTSKMNCACGAITLTDKVQVKRKCCEQFVYSLKIENQQLKQSTLDFKNPGPGIFEEKHFDFDFVRNEVLVPVSAALNYTPDLPPGRYKEPIYIQNDSFLL